MKNIFLILLLSSSILGLHAQSRNSNYTAKWFIVSLKGGIGMSGLKSDMLKHDEDISANFLNLAKIGGVKMGVLFKEKYMIIAEGAFSEWNQNYQISNPISTLSQRFKSREAALMFRYNTSYGVMFEIGGKATQVTAGKESKSTVKTTCDSLNKYFKPYYPSINVGLGFVPYKGNRIQAVVNVRGSYSIGGVIEKGKYLLFESKKDNSPNPRMYYPFVPYDETMMDNTKTNAFSLLLSIEFNYILWGSNRKAKPW